MQIITDGTTKVHMADLGPRWLIPDLPENQSDVRRFWEEQHRDCDYMTTFSVGEDAEVRSSIIEYVLECSPCNDILIVGCGSRTHLQEALLARLSSSARVVATDYSEVIAVAQQRFSHPQLTYVALENQRAFVEQFDAVVAVNVLVMASDQANRALVREWACALRHGGSLVLLAPLLFCGLELALLTEREDLCECLDLDGSAWTEKHQGMRQIEYSPLRLRRILKEAGLRQTDMRIVFLDGPTSREQSRVHYDLDDPDLVVYEQLVTATRGQP